MATKAEINKMAQERHKRIPQKKVSKDAKTDGNNFIKGKKTKK